MKCQVTNDYIVVRRIELTFTAFVHYALHDPYVMCFDRQDGMEMAASLESTTFTVFRVGGPNGPVLMG